jgi:hypothetical protein
MLVRRFLPALAAAITLAAGLVTAVETATPALAAGNPECQNIAHGLCLYADGLNGHYVYGRTIPEIENAFDTLTAKAYVCNGGFKVTSSCPFLVEQGGQNWNTPYIGDTIFTMENAPSGQYFLGRYNNSLSDVVQGQAGTGDLWVAVPVPDGDLGDYLDLYYFVNVHVTGLSLFYEYLCAQTANDPVELLTSFPGNGACVWFHSGGF